MSTVSDVLTLAYLVNGWIARMQKVNDLIIKMREEGRETLTDEERAQLQADDDAARQDLVDAINEANG